MKRQIIKIDEEKCNGCGVCVPNCHEGALQIIDGKARLIGEALCDGLGACIGECPEGAIKIEERDAEAYDEKEVLDRIIPQGINTLKAHLTHLIDHDQNEYVTIAKEYLKEKNIDFPATGKEKQSPLPCGCPGTEVRDFSRKENANSIPGSIGSGPSALRQWPVQLKLLPVKASFFEDSDLLVAADCAAFAHGNFHQRFLSGKALVMFCPKLDQDMEGYLEKLTEIIKGNNVKSVTAVRMEVPCCSGVVSLTEEAIKRSGKNLVLKEYIISVEGDIV